MKRIKLLLTFSLTLSVLLGFSQNIHDSKVMGIIPIGQKDIAVVLDETTGELYKSSPYDRDLLSIDEEIELEFNNPNKPNKANVKKPNLNKTIVCFKERDGKECSNLCITSYGDKMIGVKYTHGDINKELC